ncbi:pyruvate dehydrogenase (acetyl-transferring), homodimeric type [Hydrocarboniclastica marina]|uniref:Pyruvate dehydrogenase E1 component n=1 Tax=Hydrocarboniclastica marina TaxID=2259620 RepID=A0A4P7XIH6_9ALTE|nr:pyruvate dehydrogenase (acetyl-transferring), homodimeric type [Hydrocarboniclastica marina]MAM00074.1 pyruvate dehydrogenase (acetyl-transferring), homodimeric type [Alteromonadaceae bacterium]QCF26889.1 pyruvate dehydrogenase (acetyl-transferring), homodimeric type [Hydrocarboniclastica marina]|tara:strand:- start:1803 stop:4469 length:2667 start_codon:yes stop_codon:yes gene_type:complete
MKKDDDPTETREWIEALESVIEVEGIDRARFLLSQLSERATREGGATSFTLTTPFRNTIPAAREARMPGDLFMERRIRSLIRWNAMAMVLRANKKPGDLGGHVSSFSSAATLYDVGFNYFFHGGDEKREGDLVYFQGHSAPGIYARSYLERQFDEDKLDNYRSEVDGEGLSSYPHPWLMPDYWQFPTVSMGLGPIQAIYQAHVMKYLDSRELIEMGDRKVWCFLGDGECDEPESLGAIGLAGREKLDNLIFVVNCNLQRLDGPVRGNGKIIQELEGIFRGAGWNVLKVVWGRQWDPLFEQDKEGVMQRAMDEIVDGDLQNYKSNGGAYTRKHFFGRYPEMEELVKDLSDDDIARLNRGGHDPYKVYAAYHQATTQKGQPTVILAHTIKGYGFGQAGEAQNVAHQLKKLDMDTVKAFRDRFGVPISDDEIEEIPYYRPAPDSPEMVYMQKRRRDLGGNYPKRRKASQPLQTPDLELFKTVLDGSGDREISTTMGFVRMLNAMVKDKRIGKRVVPIVPDEARTFGMEGLFRQMGIYTSEGQKYTPQDRDQIMYYREDKQGQILEEGITEAGAMSAWMAAATSYSSNDYPLIPFYLFYSMFGFQRVGDLCWAAGDMQARGFLLGGTSGRTTLNGEGLQHQDGHSHILAGTVPNCVSYDPTYAYEVAVIVQHGMKRMYEDNENVYYYITLLNENYAHPAMPEGAEEGIIKGLYPFESVEAGGKGKKKGPRVQLLGCGSILNEVRAAGQLLKDDFGVSSDIWSATSFNELARDGQHVVRWNRLHPDDKPRVPYVTQCLQDKQGPVIASTDYIKLFADQIRAFVPARYAVLGTDGYGRSDTREKLRSFFEVDRYHVVVAALSALAEDGEMERDKVLEAMRQYGIDRNKPNPLLS